MDYLYVRNRAVAAGDTSPGAITAKGKHVVVIGGGDTGADCVGNSLREGAADRRAARAAARAAAKRPDDRTPWPLWPQKYRLSYAMEEGKAVGKAEQDFSIVTTHLDGRGRRGRRRCTTPRPRRRRRSGRSRAPRGRCRPTSSCWRWASCIPEQELLDQFGVDKDPRGNIKAPTYATSVDGVFAAGDCRRGQSLIVWAINEGRQAARMADRYLCELGGSEPQPVVVGGGDADEGPEGPPQHVNGSM